MILKLLYISNGIAIKINQKPIGYHRTKKMREKNEYDCKCYQQGFGADAESWRENFTRLRQQLRQILYEKNVRSNPAVDDQWIINELRKLLHIEDSPHRFLNFH